MKRRARAIVAYACAAGISIIAATFLLELPKADLRVPFQYEGDVLQYGSAIKNTVEHGWFWTNPAIGAPGGMSLYDYPNVAHESFHLLLIKGMSVFTGNWALLLNLYFLLGFPLITLSAMAVFRRCGAGHGPAAIGGVLYAFLPTRLLKGEGHEFLDVFYQVPLAILVLLWVCGDDPPLARAQREPSGPPPPHGPRRHARTVAALLICVLNASTSAYYAFFFACLLVAGGLWASVERRSMRNAVAGGALAAVIVAAMAANGLPSIIHHLRQGPNPEVGRREAQEAEIQGLRITQLLLPVDGHRVEALRWLKDRYNGGAPFMGEGSTTSLGFVGGAGFLALIAAVLSRRRRSQDFGQELLPPLAVLNLCAVLLGTIGGFGSLFALLVSPQIRTYSRLGVLIGFFALFAVVIGLERLQRWRPRVGALALPVVLLVGLLDQVSPAAIRPYRELKQTFASDRELVHRIEAQVPAGSMIFQLPYLSFPEAPHLFQLSSNELLRPYLHSSTVRWSLPTMRGRSGDLFAREVARREPGALVATLAGTGFGGILIDRRGYSDDAAALEAALRTRLDAPPLSSADGRLLFFDLGDELRRAGARRAPDEIDRVLHPLIVTFADGFYELELMPGGTFRWCQETCDLHINNDSGVPRQAAIRMTMVAARGPARLTIAGGEVVSASVALAGALPFAREIVIPPGHQRVRFRCDGQAASVPNNPRTLIWRMENFTLQELPAPGGQNQNQSP